MQPTTDVFNKKFFDTVDEITEFNEIIQNLPEAVATRQHLAAVFRTIHQKMNEGFHYKDILDSIFSSLDGIIPFDRIGIALLNGNSTIRLFWVKAKTPIKWLKENYFEALEESILMEVINSGEVIIISDLKKYYNRYPHYKSAKLLLLDGMNSGLVCPLRSEGKTIGAITFSSVDTDTYKSIHIDLFQEISENLSLIISKELLKQTIREAGKQESLFMNFIHDLNNPLTVIKASLDIIETKEWYNELGKDSKKSFKMLKRSCDSMIDNIHSLVYKKKKIQSKRSFATLISLKEYLDEIGNECELLGRKKGIKTITEMGLEVPQEVVLDRTTTKEAIDNLISNAIKFSPANSTIKIRLDFNSKENTLFFTVKDNGPGIPKEEHSILFKEHGITSVKGSAGEPSSGIGLSNVKRIIESQEGNVFFKSEVGVGSTFGFWIPVKNAPLH